MGPRPRVRALAEPRRMSDDDIADTNGDAHSHSDIGPDRPRRRASGDVSNSDEHGDTYTSLNDNSAAARPKRRSGSTTTKRSSSWLAKFGPKHVRKASLSDDVPCLIAETSTLITRDIECALYKWSPPKKDGKDARIRGVAVVYHGFGAHSLYPTVRYASSLLAESGLLVYGLDFPGHGASPGKRGLIKSVDDLIDDGIAVALHAKTDSSKRGDYKQLPLFLVGSSMGGAIALAVANAINDSVNDTVNGVVMLAPMLSLSVGSTARKALGWLNTLVPTVPLIPSAATSPEMQYRDADRRAECERNTLTYKGSMR